MTRDARGEHAPRVQLVWHLHQPYYGIPHRDAFYLPWVRLHATKCYYDMACMLERHPEVHATVNFSGSLLRQFREMLDEGRRDMWWDLSLKPASALDDHDKRHMLRHFFSVDPACRARHRRYQELFSRRGDLEDVSVLDIPAYRDLQMWFNLAWFGFSAREERPIVRELIAKQRGFTEAEKEALLEQQIDVMHRVIPLYRELHRRGQIELSVSPMYHPILPLVIDSSTAQHAAPDHPMPSRMLARSDAVAQVETARGIAREVLGVDVDGMWPAEGAVSLDAVSVFAEYDLRWIASDEQVLERSLGDWDRGRDLNHPYRLGAQTPAIFFRDRVLSDEIAFRCAELPAEEAAAHLVDRVIDASGDVLTLVLDGENPWAPYPDDGEAFLGAFYRALVERGVQTTTPTRVLDDVPCRELPTLWSGSWIDASFTAWIGQENTNQAWNALRTTRHDLVAELQRRHVDEDDEVAAWESLWIAQGSDWFWWYGGNFTSLNDADFDRLFRAQLRAVYTALALTPPAFVEEPFTNARQVLRFTEPRRLIAPRVDGAIQSLHEWEGAGIYEVRDAAMYDSARFVERIFIGFDLDHLFLRVDWTNSLRANRRDVVLVMHVQHQRGRFEVELREGGTVRWLDDDSEIGLTEFASGSSIEAAVEWSSLELDAGDTLRVRFDTIFNGNVREHHPPVGAIELTVPDASFDARNTTV